MKVFKADYFRSYYVFGFLFFNLKQCEEIEREEKFKFISWILLQEGRISVFLKETYWSFYDQERRNKKTSKSISLNIFSTNPKERFLVKQVKELAKKDFQSQTPRCLAKAV